MILSYQEKTPNIAPDVFVAPTAVIEGDVTIGRGSSIWYGAVIRGDMEPVTIGEDTNIQDNCCIHTDHGAPVVIGNGVTVGHNAVIHACVVEDLCLVGLGALVLNGAAIKTGSIVAAGTVVKQYQVVGPGHLVAGNPATLKKKLGQSDETFLLKAVEEYRKLADLHMAEPGGTLREIEPTP